MKVDLKEWRSRCSADWMSAPCDQISELLDIIEKQHEALEFYANPHNYYYLDHKVDVDGGLKAQEALALVK